MEYIEEHYASRRINVRAIIINNGKLFIVKHKHGNDISSYYATPGAGLDPHESLTDCLIRELHEETGVTAKPGKLLFIQQFPSSRLGYEEELEFFFSVENPEDFINIDLSNTTHGHDELALWDYVNPKDVWIYPSFLKDVDLDKILEYNTPTLVFDNLHKTSI